MVDPKDNSEIDILSPDFVLDRTLGRRGMVRRILDVDFMNSALKHHCDTMDETPLLSSLDSLNLASLYLKETGIKPDVLKPLIALYDALDDLSRGVKNPLLDISSTERGVPRNPGKRQNRSYAYNMAMAAAAVTLSGRGYMKEATVRAANRIGVNRKDLKAFRRDISSGRIKDQWSNTLYKMHVDQCKADSPEEKRLFSKGIIEDLLSPIRTE